VSLARQVMQQIIAHGGVTRGWVGIEVQDITPEIADSFNLQNTEGALIAVCAARRTGRSRGIRPGDILVRVNDQPVADSSSCSTSSLPCRRANRPCWD
jgi:serine protease DegQ